MSNADATLTITTNEYRADVRAEFDTPQDAADFAARFPKSCKMTAPSLNGHSISMAHLGQPDRGVVHVSITLAANGVNGGVNETGLKRLATIRRTASRLGITLVER